MEEELSENEKIVKSYLDKQSESDGALKSFYVPSRIKDCFNYITEQTRKKAVNNCAMIEDTQVYKWARDYYLEVLPKENDKDATEIVQKSAEIEKKADEAVRTAERCSEETKKVLAEADKALEKADKNGQLMFEF